MASRTMTPLSKTPRALALGVTAAGLALTLGGCASSGEADDLYATTRALEERNLMLQQELQAKDNTIGLLRSRVGEADDTVAQVRDRNAALQSDLRRLEERYRTLSGRLDQVSVGIVDPATEQALERLARENPNLLTYDARRGMLRFNSDVTFAPGSDDVSDQASSALQQVAGVLSQAASAYDLRIVGHTDSVKPSRPATLRNHPTNTHLSVHRAIAVRDVLASAGVPRVRMEVAGWGEYRPAVPNNAAQGTPQNRRVEIYMVPSSTEVPGTVSAPQDDQRSSERKEQPERRPEPFK